MAILNLLTETYPQEELCVNDIDDTFILETDLSLEILLIFSKIFCIQSNSLLFGSICNIRTVIFGPLLFRMYFQLPCSSASQYLVNITLSNDYLELPIVPATV